MTCADKGTTSMQHTTAYTTSFFFKSDQWKADSSPRLQKIFKEKN